MPVFPLIPIFLTSPHWKNKKPGCGTYCPAARFCFILRRRVANTTCKTCQKHTVSKNMVELHMNLVEYHKKYCYYYDKENIVKPRNPEIYGGSASLNKQIKVCSFRSYVTGKSIPLCHFQEEKWFLNGICRGLFFVVEFCGGHPPQDSSL